MVSCSAINCGNSSFKYKIEQVKLLHWVLSNDKTLWKKWLAVIKGDPPYQWIIFFIYVLTALLQRWIFSAWSQVRSPRWREEVQVTRYRNSINCQFHKESENTRKKHDIIDEVCSFRKHSNDTFENIDITHVRKMMWLIQNIVWLLILIFITLLVHNVQIQVLFDAILR